ncbi:hypothetical protein EBT16_06305, partial [bacterium]|nr:hypothetical protein [bacterium]
MALVGSVITRNMLANHIYAGVPAQDITEKMGSQFEERTPERKKEALENILSEFISKNPQYQGSLRACLSYPINPESGVTYFNVSDRTYSQNYSEPEVAFLKSWVPLVKFIPRGAPIWLSPTHPKAR